MEGWFVMHKGSELIFFAFALFGFFVGWHTDREALIDKKEKTLTFLSNNFNNLKEMLKKF